MGASSSRVQADSHEHALHRSGSARPRVDDLIYQNVRGGGGLSVCRIFQLFVSPELKFCQVLSAPDVNFDSMNFNGKFIVRFYFRCCNAKIINPNSVAEHYLIYHDFYRALTGIHSSQLRQKQHLHQRVNLEIDQASILPQST